MVNNRQDLTRRELMQRVGAWPAAVSVAAAEACPVPIERLGIADTFAESGPYAELLDKYGMSEEAITAAVERVLARKQRTRAAHNTT